jgi:adenine-specific DNA-methyltransferase
VLPNTALSLTRVIRSLQDVAERRGPAALTTTLLALWQASHFPRLCSGGPRADHRLVRDPRVQKFAIRLGEQSLPDATFWLSSAYASWLGSEARSEAALYFTPPRLAARLVRDLVTHGASLRDHLWIDPACGGAAFLAPVARRMADARANDGWSAANTLRHVSHHLAGNDLDPFLCLLSRQFLRMALYPEISAARVEPRFAVTCRDALEGPAQRPSQTSVVICNPPYRKLSRLELEHHRQRYHQVIDGQANIYSLFFKLSLDLVSPDGVVGLITPTSFLSGLHFAGLRAYLLERGTTVQMAVVRNREGVFVGVQQETAMSILRRRTAHSSPQATKLFVLGSRGHFTKIGQCVFPNSGRVWPVPRTAADAALFKKATASPYRLVDYGYRARVGAFVWNRDKRRTFRTEKAARRVRPENKFPLIWSSDISTDGSFRLGRRSVSYDHDRFVNMRGADHRSIVRRPCVVLQRVTSPDQPRRLVAAPLQESLFARFGGVVGENHVVFLEQIAGRPILLTPAELALVLQCEPIDRVFRCISGVVNVSVFELSQLPLPSPAALAQQLKLCSASAAVIAAFEIE